MEDRVKALEVAHLPRRARLDAAALLEEDMFRQARQELERQPSLLNVNKRVYRRLTER